MLGRHELVAEELRPTHDATLVRRTSPTSTGGACEQLPLVFSVTHLLPGLLPGLKNGASHGVCETP